MKIIVQSEGRWIELKKTPILKENLIEAEKETSNCSRESLKSKMATLKIQGKLQGKSHRSDLNIF